MSDSDDTINSAYALAQKSKREAENTSYTPPPDCEEARRVLEFLKAIRALTKDWFASVLEDRGVGHFHQSSDRPFNRNLLFIKSEVGNVFQIYIPCWLDEIKKCHLQLWSAANNDPDVKELYSYVQSFKHEWEDFFQTLSNRFPDAADNLLSDFETAGLQMFGNLDASISYARARTPDAEIDHDVFLAYLPEVKKLFIRASEKSTLNSNSPLNFDDACHRLHEEEMKSRKDRWLKFRDLLLEAGLTIPIEEWPIPTDWNSKNVNLIYAHLLEQINWSLDQIRNSSNPMTPQDNWESLLPEVFSFDLGRFAFSQMETYDDGIYRTVTLKDGSTINISKSSDSSYITYPPRDQCVAALEEYIREGVRISKLINSTSNRTWRKAEAKFQKHRTLINLPISYHAMKELGELLHDARIELTLDIEDYAVQQFSSENNPTEEVLVEKLAAKIREKPLDANIVSVAPSAGKSLRAALKDPGGRPEKTHGGAKVMTQAEMATAFGSPCNENMVNGWEARAAGKKRGANPPDTLYNGERIIYSAELRTNPTPDNENRLSALIAEFQSRHRIKEAIGEKARHMKSPETLAKASGQVAAAIRERSQLKYEK